MLMQIAFNMIHNSHFIHFNVRLHVMQRKVLLSQFCPSVCSELFRRRHSTRQSHGLFALAKHLLDFSHYWTVPLHTIYFLKPTASSDRRSSLTLLKPSFVIWLHFECSAPWGLTYHYLASRKTLYMLRHIRLSLCHTPVLCQNE